MARINGPGKSHWLSALPTVVLLGFCAAGCVSWAEVVTPNTPIRSAQAIRTMTPGMAERHIRVVLDAVVTYVDLPWQNLFVQDGTAGIYVFLNDCVLTGTPEAGSRVRIEGVTIPGQFVPGIGGHVHVTVLGQAPLPKPVIANEQELFSGLLDSQWTQLNGVVRFAEVRRDHLYVSLDRQGRRLTLRMNQVPSDLMRSLPDSEVQVTGVVSTQFNQRRQVIGVNMVVPDRALIRIVRPAPDPFSMPLSHAANLGQFSGAASNHRVHIKGVVEARENSDTMYVSDRGVAIAVRGKCDAHVGDLVDVAGFPELGDYHRTLADSLCHHAGRGTLMPARQVRVEDVLQNNVNDQAADTVNDLATLSTDAEVLQVSGAAAFTILLKSGDTVFEATEGEKPKKDLLLLEPGSHVRVQGLCLIRYDQFQRAVGFRIIVRRPSDVMLLSRPSWWNARHTFWVLGATLAGAAVILFWVLTLRRRVEQQTAALREKLLSGAKLERRYQRLFESNLAAVVSVDTGGRILDCNTAFGLLLGRDAASLVGTAFYNYLVSLPDFGRFTSTVMATGAAPNTELALHRGDSSTIVVIASGILTEMEGDERIIQATLIDITAQKQIEHELIKSKEAAEIASQLKSEFLASMSHEIRTPLNGMLGMTSLALAGNIDSEVREYLQMAQDSATHLLSLLNDVLDYSKIEAGRMDLERVPFEPRDVIRRAVRTLAVKAHEKRLEILYSVDDSVPRFVLGDPHRLQQVLLNLMGNAVKFTSVGQVMVRAKAESKGSEINLCVRVEDSGPGIPDDKRKQIFEPFIQADDSTTRKFGGTGLGLSISAQLVRLLGGEISVDSKLGEGSTFAFNCMFGANQAKCVDGIPDRVALAGREAVVCVENAALELELTRSLRAWGMQVLSMQVAAAMGNKWLLSSARPLVICDCRCGEANLIAAFEFWRDQPNGPIPVVLLDAIDMRSLVDRCKAKNVAFLLKPVDAEELRSVLTRCLEQYSAPAEPIPSIEVASAATPGRRLSVLVAEDNLVNQKLASALLRKAGHDVEIVANGRDAVRAAASKRYDVILMDVQMPEMDGFEATACIRNFEKESRNVPIIALTAHALEGYREKCMKAGMNEFLTKPIDSTRLMAALNSIAKGVEPVRA